MMTIGTGRHCAFNSSGSTSSSGGMSFARMTKRLERDVTEPQSGAFARAHMLGIYEKDDLVDMVAIEAIRSDERVVPCVAARCWK